MPSRLHSNQNRMVRFFQGQEKKLRSLGKNIELTSKVSEIVMQPEGGIFKFTDIPIVSGPTAISDDVDYIHMYDNGLKLFVNNIGVKGSGSQALLGTSDGIDYSHNPTDDEGIQWALADPNAIGYTRGTECQKYTVGNFPFYARLKFSIADVSDTDTCMFGFRKVEDFQADPNDYDELFAFNSNAGDIECKSILNNASTSSTSNMDSGDNWSDGETRSFTVFVAKSGNCVGAYDDKQKDMIALSAGFSFDKGEVVTPFFYFIHSAASSAGVVLQELEHGRGLE